MRATRRRFGRGRIGFVFGAFLAAIVLASGGSADAGPPTIASDKDDYAPGERVTLTGAGWQVGEHVHINVNDDDGATWQRDVDVVADTDGRITDSFTLPDWFVALYRVTATGEASGIASTSFTDARIVTTATVDGGSSVTVSPSAAIASQVTVTTDGSGANARWRSTSWLIATTDPATVSAGTCVNHADHDGAAVGYVESLNVNAPSAAGTYNAYFKAHADDTCGGAGGGTSALFKLTNAVTVVIDNTAPVGSVSINNGALATNSTSVTLNLDATDAIGVTAYRIANVASCAAASYVPVTSTTTFSVSLAHTLPSVDGTKTVCAQYRDAAGNQSATYTDSIVLDTTAPTITNTGVQSGTTGSNGWYTSSVTNRFTATDTGSGLSAACQTAFPSGNRDVSSGSAEGTSVTVSSGSCTDVAGNANPGISSASFKIDFTAPSSALSVTAGTLGSNGWYTSDVTVHTSGTDSIASPVSCTGDQSQMTETAGQAFNGSCTNDAGLTTNATSLTIKLDGTAPTLTDLGPTTNPNANGWYKTDVTNRFQASDGLSGPDSDCLADYPASGGDRIQSKTTTGQGTAVTVTSNGCTDLAGNTAAAKTSAAFQIDKTAPTASASAAPPANANGWNNTNVTVSFSGNDGLSGIDFCDPDEVLSSEGAGQSASGDCTDKAGNVSASATVSGIKIDKTAPTASASAAPPANANGWNNTNVTVSFSGNDGLSGIDFCDPDEVLSSEGAGQSASGTCTDKAGNVSGTATASGIKIDKTKPSIVHHDFSPAANGAGWHNSDITVRFKASDALSGLNAACETAFPNVSGDRIQSKLITTEGSAVTVESDSCTDLAGNTAAAKTSDAFNLDKTAPTASANAAPAPNGNGWNNTNVTVTFTGHDGLSGIASCDPPVVLSSDGAGQSASGTCADVASNPSATATASGINIDKTAPTLTWSGGPASGSSHYFGSVPLAPTCGAVDALSGPDTCLVNGYGTTVGPHTMTATAKDKAGNTHSEQRSYTVLAWTLNGFYQPVDMNGVFNTVKNGSTVPLKFEIFAGTTELTDPASVKSLTSAQINCDASAPLDEVEAVATGGTTLRYDSTGGQFIYNWKTPSTAGKCYRVTMTSQDGSSLVAFFKLK